MFACLPGWAEINCPDVACRRVYCPFNHPKRFDEEIDFLANDTEIKPSIEDVIFPMDTTSNTSTNSVEVISEDTHMVEAEPYVPGVIPYKPTIVEEPMKEYDDYGIGIISNEDFEKDLSTTLQESIVKAKIEKLSEPENQLEKIETKVRPKSPFLRSTITRDDSKTKTKSTTLTPLKGILKKRILTEPDKTNPDEKPVISNTLSLPSTKLTSPPTPSSSTSTITTSTTTSTNTQNLPNTSNQTSTSNNSTQTSSSNTPTKTSLIKTTTAKTKTPKSGKTRTLDIVDDKSKSDVSIKRTKTSTGTTNTTTSTATTNTSVTGSTNTGKTEKTTPSLIKPTTTKLNAITKKTPVLKKTTTSTTTTPTTTTTKASTTPTTTTTTTPTKASTTTPTTTTTTPKNKTPIISTTTTTIKQSQKASKVVSTTDSNEDDIDDEPDDSIPAEAAKKISTDKIMSQVGQNLSTADYPIVAYVHNSKIPRAKRQQMVDTFFKGYLQLYPEEKREQAVLASLFLELEIYKQCNSLVSYRGLCAQKYQILKKRVKEGE